MHIVTMNSTGFNAEEITTLMLQRFTQLGVTVSTLNFFGSKLPERIPSRRAKGVQRLFILPQPPALRQAA
jgi:hypothetical protein